MANIVLTETTASISELKKNPMGTVAAGEGFPVAILNRNETAFYCVPAKAYEALLEKLEDLELNAIADARSAQAVIKIDLGSVDVLFTDRVSPERGLMQDERRAV